MTYKQQKLFLFLNQEIVSNFRELYTYITVTPIFFKYLTTD